jgi:hypothetical protein
VGEAGVGVAVEADLVGTAVVERPELAAERRAIRW